MATSAEGAEHGSEALAAGGWKGRWTTFNQTKFPDISTLCAHAYDVNRRAQRDTPSAPLVNSATLCDNDADCGVTRSASQADHHGVSSAIRVAEPPRERSRAALCTNSPSVRTTRSSISVRGAAVPLRPAGNA